MRLHLGCGSTTPPGWVNVDYSLGARLGRLPGIGALVRASGLFAIDWSRDIRLHDLRRPFPFPDASARVIYSAHTLEHLSRDEGARFLRECHRVLAPDGVARIVVPDLRAILDAYEKGRFPAVELLDRLGVFAEQPGDGRLKRWLAPWVRFPHRCMYDARSLLASLGAAGFDARLHAPGVSRIAELEDVEREERTEGGLIVEATRRSGT
jgi:SAM-dependent methyltransferase